MKLWLLKVKFIIYSEHIDANALHISFENLTNLIKQATAIPKFQIILGNQYKHNAHCSNINTAY